VIVVRPGLKTLTNPAFCEVVIVAMLLSDEVNVHGAGEFEDGAMIVNVLAVVGDWLYVTSLNSPMAVVAPRIVNVIVSVEDP
jgi:hypothetical protein